MSTCHVKITRWRNNNRVALDGEWFLMRVYGSPNYYPFTGWTLQDEICFVTKLFLEEIVLSKKKKRIFEIYFLNIHRRSDVHHYNFECFLLKWTFNQIYIHRVTNKQRLRDIKLKSIIYFINYEE